MQRLPNWHNSTKGQLNKQELIPIECGLVMLGLSTRNNWKDWEFKSLKRIKILLRFLSNRKNFPLLCSVILSKKIKLDYLKSRLIKIHLDLKVEGKKLKSIISVLKNLPMKSKINNTTWKMISVWRKITMEKETKTETKECQQDKVKEFGINCIKFLILLTLWFKF